MYFPARRSCDNALQTVLGLVVFFTTHLSQQQHLRYEMTEEGMSEMPAVISIQEKMRLHNKVQQQHLSSGTLPAKTSSSAT